MKFPNKADFSVSFPISLLCVETAKQRFTAIQFSSKLLRRTRKEFYRLSTGGLSAQCGISGFKGYSQEYLLNYQFFLKTCLTNRMKDQCPSFYDIFFSFVLVDILACAAIKQEAKYSNASC